MRRRSDGSAWGLMTGKFGFADENGNLKRNAKLLGNCQMGNCHVR